jgi:hypothetical protein
VILVKRGRTGGIFEMSQLTIRRSSVSCIVCLKLNALFEFSYVYTCPLCAIIIIAQDLSFITYDKAIITDIIMVIALVNFMALYMKS